MISKRAFLLIVNHVSFNRVTVLRKKKFVEYLSQLCAAIIDAWILIDFNGL